MSERESDNMKNSCEKYWRKNDDENNDKKVKETNNGHVSRYDTKNVENVIYKCTSEPIAIHPLPSIKQVEAPPLILN